MSLRIWLNMLQNRFMLGLPIGVGDDLENQLKP